MTEADRHTHTRLPAASLETREVAAALAGIGDLMRSTGLPAPLAVCPDRDGHVGVMVSPTDFGAWHDALAAQEPAATRGLSEPAVRVRASASVAGIDLVLEASGSGPALISALRDCGPGRDVDAAGSQLP